MARFVANIPFVSDNLAFPGVCDIWSTCDVSFQVTLYLLSHFLKYFSSLRYLLCIRKKEKLFNSRLSFSAGYYSAPIFLQFKEFELYWCAVYF